jgi:A/G-specific adenine glycosylase
VRKHYSLHGRDLPWRETSDPYRILLSEVMLQQTQVNRVLGKYCGFVESFPTINDLAASPLADVLRMWQGLGYNRRALNLHTTAKMIASEHSGTVPDSLDDLRRFPGIGHATAAAILAFAYSVAVPFIETNIRAAFIFHFFKDGSNVSDSDILRLVRATLDHDNPRVWYYSLMDYGSWLKSAFPNPSRKSAHWSPQSRFEGSHRQLRALLLRSFLTGTQLESAHSRWSRSEIDETIEELVREGFLIKSAGIYLPA